MFSRSIKDRGRHASRVSDDQSASKKPRQPGMPGPVLDLLPKRLRIREGLSLNALDSSWSRQYPSGALNIMFLHGGAGRLSMWNGQIAHFSKSFRTIAFDLMGHGDSDRLGMYGTIGQYADDAQALLRIIDAQVRQTVFVGYSLGANVALKLAQRHEVCGLVLIGMHLSKSFTGMSYRTMHMILKDLACGTWPGYRHGVNALGFLSAVRAYLKECDSTPQKSGRPVLLLNGEKDLMTPRKESERLAACLPNSELRFFPHASHDVHSDPDFNSILEKFIEGCRTEA